MRRRRNTRRSFRRGRAGRGRGRVRSRGRGRSRRTSINARSPGKVGYRL